MGKERDWGLGIGIYLVFLGYGSVLCCKRVGEKGKIVGVAGRRRRRGNDVWILIFDF